MTHSDSITEVQQRFAQWRQSRSRGNARIPDGLRQQAVALCDRYPIVQVTQALRINHAMIKAWRQTNDTATFVPLDLTVESPDTVQLCLLHPNGMRLQLTGLDQAQLSRLFSQFMAVPA